ncbi:glycosyltransferase family 8 protein [Lacisediminimonas sp.]|uniref:glycosyltransferase family 8 protein n=1 Tax=Lacisediminimonas sp. TaxID=3060582 RepID=UPI00271CF5E3|nr:glycosyltransferase [Lacisediminimonas sp.]MDO8298122.1 glycosyltransferase [Lacisediminimonas sp.]
MNLPSAAASKRAEARDDPALHIAFCVDDNYFRSMGATIASIIANNPGRQFIFHVLAFEVAERHRAGLLELERRFDVRTQLHIIDPASFRELGHFVRNSYYSLSIFSRLLIPAVLEGVASKVLYLDADILCVGKLDELIDMDLGSDIAAAVADAPLTAERRSRALGLKHGRYFNSGVLLINVDNWIAHQVTARTLEVLAQGKKRLRFSDQDALNIVLGEHIGYLDGKFNTIYDLVHDMDRNVRTMHAPDKAVLLHFAGAIKPWADWHRHEARALFCRYHAMSPWADMPLDPAPRNPREMRLQSRFLKNRGEFRSALVWYGRYLRARLGQGLRQ